MARSWINAGIGIYAAMSLSFGIVQAAENIGGGSEADIVLYDAGRNKNSADTAISNDNSSVENRNNSTGTANASSSTGAGADPGHDSDNTFLKGSDSGDEKLPGQEKSTRGNWSSSTPDFDEELVLDSGSDSNNDNKQNMPLKSSDNEESEHKIHDRDIEEKLSTDTSSAANESQGTESDYTTVPDSNRDNNMFFKSSAGEENLQAQDVNSEDNLNPGNHADFNAVNNEGSSYDSGTDSDRDNNMFFKSSAGEENLQAQDVNSEDNLNPGNHADFNVVNNEGSSYDSGTDSNQDNMFFKPYDGIERDKQVKDEYIEEKIDSIHNSTSNEVNDEVSDYGSKSGSNSDSDKVYFKYSNRSERDFPGKSGRDEKDKSRYEWIFNDDSYNYYLDLKSCKWVRLPYSASEYMIDVWVCLVSTGSDSFVDEYDDEGNIVGRQLKYYMEHYYIRPSTQQIQFLCELEVTGRPQNTISEREYRVKNWENLIPGSIEDEIYRVVVKRMGKKGSSSKGHMGFFDMVEEYARISL